MERIEHFSQVDGVFVFLGSNIPVRRSALVRTVESGRTVQRMTFYIPPHEIWPNGYDSSLILPNDVLRRHDGTEWRALRIERPQYRSRWASVAAERRHS